MSDLICGRIAAGEKYNLTCDRQAVVGVILAAMSGGIGGAAVGGLGTIIWNHDDGYGTKIRMTNMGKTAIVTGVYSLTRSQEKTIAMKNRII